MLGCVWVVLPESAPLKNSPGLPIIVANCIENAPASNNPDNSTQKLLKCNTISVVVAVLLYTPYSQIMHILVAS